MAMDKKTNVIDKLQSKYNMIVSDEIKEKLKSSKNPYNVVVRVLQKGNTLTTNEIVWTPELIYDGFNIFVDIIDEISDYMVVVPSIEMFCLFMNWSTKLYEEMFNSTEYNHVVSLVNDYLIDCQLSAGQQGILTQNLTKFRMQVQGEHGFNQTTTKPKVIAIGEANSENRVLLSTEEITNNINLLLNRTTVDENAETETEEVETTDVQSSTLL